jgi:hypothetical protein
MKTRKAIPYLEILNRITGVSIPIFGVSWNPPELEIERARHLIVFLEDRRVLFQRNQEMPTWANKSVIEIRERLTSELETLDEKSSLAKSLVEMRRACRKYLDTVQVLDLSTDNIKVNGLFRDEEEIFLAAINELRVLFGSHIAQIAIQFGIDVETELASILPKKTLEIPPSTDISKQLKIVEARRKESLEQRNKRHELLRERASGKREISDEIRKESLSEHKGSDELLKEQIESLREKFKK